MFSISGQCLRVMSLVSYCKIPKISPVALTFVGANIRRGLYTERNLRFIIG